MHAHWSNHPSLLTPAECEMVIKHAQRHYEPHTAVVGHGAHARQDQMRSSTVRWLKYSDLELLWLRLRIEEKILEANRTFGYHLQAGFTEIQFTEYHGPVMPRPTLWQRFKGAPEFPRVCADTGDHYDWHEDNSALMEKAMDRKLSFVLQLSDSTSYQGGKFELDSRAHKLPETAFSQQGDALIFRSAIKHRVLPVTAGARYSLVTWVHGPRA
jgi:PKHD-type hydroxylase